MIKPTINDIKRQIEETQSDAYELCQWCDRYYIGAYHAHQRIHSRPEATEWESY